MSNYDPFADPAAAGSYTGQDPNIQALLQYVMGGGQQYLGAATPTLSMGQFNTAYGMVPQDDDMLRQQARGANFAQDLMSMQADTMFGAYAGAGAYDPAAFQPMINQQLYDSPELTAFNTYLVNPQSFRGSVATILKEGGDPSTLVADLQQLLGFDPLDYTDPQLNPIARELPWIQDQRTGQPMAIDWVGVQNEIQKVTDQFNAIPQPGPMGQETSDDGTVISESGERQWTYDDAGRLVVSEQTYKPSPMTEEYRRLGLPDPMQEYTPEYILGPEWEQTYQNYLGATQNLEAARGALQNPDLRPSMDWEREGPTAVPAAPGWGGGGAEAPAGPEPTHERPQVAEQLQYGLPGWAGVVPAIDPTREIAQGLEAALNSDDPNAAQEWMDANWNTIPQRDQTDAREVLALHNLSPSVFGYEEQPEGTGPSQAEAVGMPSLSDVATSSSGYLPGEAAQAMEGQILSGNTASWLAGNFSRLTPDEQGEVQQTLIDYGLNLSDYGYGGGGGSGNRPQVRSKLGAQALKTRGGGEEPVPPPTDLTWAGGPTEWFGGGRETPPPPAEQTQSMLEMFTNPQQYPDRQSWEAAQGQPRYPYPDRQSWELAQGQPTGQTPPTPPGSETAPWGTTPDRPTDQAMLDYMLSSILPNYPASAGAREQQAQALHEGARVRTLAQMRAADQEPRYQFPGGGHMYGTATGENVRMTEPVGIENEQYGPRYQFPYDSTGARANWVTQATGPPQSERATHRGDVTDQAMVDYMLSSILPNYPTTTGARDQQAQAVHEGNRVRSIAELTAAEQQPRYQFPGGGHMYGTATGLPTIETGERRRQQAESELAGQTVLGGTTDRTGKRVRPTRSPEQARRNYQAHQLFRQAWLNQQQARQDTYGYDHGYAAGLAMRLREQGVTPTSSALAARQLPIAAMGIMSPGQYAR